MSTKLTGNDVLALGYPAGPVIGLALDAINKYFPDLSPDGQKVMLAGVLATPDAFENDPALGAVANALQLNLQMQMDRETRRLREQPLPYNIYGAEYIDPEALKQMNTAMKLPVTVGGALMPDAHVGYGLPIGGVLATEGAIIPYAVGVDIGCRMALSVYDLPGDYIDTNKKQLKQLLNDNTRFGAARGFEKPIDHEVLDRREFREIPVARGLLDRAWKQIGSSGSGNHFVEWGTIEVNEPSPELNLPPGRYLALLSHSGSRGLGAQIANHYTRIAKDISKLPDEARNLAWLPLSTEAGEEYWRAMNLAGDYASANHDQIHARMARSLGLNPVVKVENHHNFAWKERLPDGREVMVHRKGATPAGQGILGIIPGSMTDPGFVVRGKGNPDALQSASHGAGRQLSRTQAMKNITPKDLKQRLAEYGVELMGGGLDEAPMAYKDIKQVMQHQRDLVDILAVFQPRLVRMDDSGSGLDI